MALLQGQRTPNSPCACVSVNTADYNCILDCLEQQMSARSEIRPAARHVLYLLQLRRDTSNAQYIQQPGGTVQLRVQDGMRRISMTDRQAEKAFLYVRIFKVPST